MNGRFFDLQFCDGKEEGFGQIICCATKFVEDVGRRRSFCEKKNVVCGWKYDEISRFL
jgi:hypothetical protein